MSLYYKWPGGVNTKGKPNYLHVYVCMAGVASLMCRQNTLPCPAPASERTGAGQNTRDIQKNTGG